MSKVLETRRARRFCAAPDCDNNSESCTLSFFSFPKDPERSKKWIENSGRFDLIAKKPLDLSKNTYLCTNHFEDSNFSNIKNKKNRLTPTAVPTIFTKSGIPHLGTATNQPILDPGMENNMKKRLEKELEKALKENEILKKMNKKLKLLNAKVQRLERRSRHSAYLRRF
uniref:THAP-type domain-containing protein n=1 Tax=Strigamia maritima TaxID=126957 RepID=T1J2Y5_STRMM